MSSPLQIVAGLGNPGEEYAATRHNAGFWFLDALAERLGIQLKRERRFACGLGRFELRGHRGWLLRPHTYMNLSGDPVSAVARYFDVPAEQILVCHDELDLDAGVIRLKQDGGLGGHNGLRDIAAKLGSRAFWRLRFGIGRPPGGQQGVDYVLSRPSAQQKTAILAAIDVALAESDTLLTGEFQRSMNALHRTGRQPAAEDPPSNGSSG